MLLSVRGLCRSYGPRPVLVDVGLRVGAGEAVAVTGPNGSGKSTLLRCIAGLDRPSAGTVELCGEPLRETDPRTRRRIAAALEDLDFFPDLAVAEHLALLLLAHGDPAPDEHAAALLDEGGLGEVAGQLPVGLSSGQRRRVALLTCFARPRDLVVLDEPEQRLDRNGREWLIRQLQQEKSAGHGVLLATHDPELTRRVADRVVALS